MNDDFVLTAHVPRPTTEGCKCSTNENGLNPRGLFTAANETRVCLLEIHDMLQLFSREIEPVPQGDTAKLPDPTSFTEELYQIAAIAHAVKGDLNDLIEKFRR